MVFNYAPHKDERYHLLNLFHISFCRIVQSYLIQESNVPIFTILPKWAITIFSLVLSYVSDLVPDPAIQCTVVAGGNPNSVVLLMEYQQL
jgi:hypothetical protein